jgi:hypothetical protein
MPDGGVSRQTVYDWTEAHPEFMDAKNIGDAKADREERALT